MYHYHKKKEINIIEAFVEIIAILFIAWLLVSFADISTLPKDIRSVMPWNFFLITNN